MAAYDAAVAVRSMSAGFTTGALTMLAGTFTTSPESFMAGPKPTWAPPRFVPP